MTYLEQLLTAHNNSPHDETILSAIAIYYIHHPDGNKDLDYLKKAYQKKATAVTINNYAYFLAAEYGKYQDALAVISRIHEIKTTDFYPYATHAQILFSTGQIDNPNHISQERHHKIINLSQIALDNFKLLPKQHQYSQFDKCIFLKNNIIISKIMTGQMMNVERLFDELYQDITFAYQNPDVIYQKSDNIDEWHYKILLNHAYYYLLVGKKTNVYELMPLIKLCQNADDLDVASLYALLNDTQNCFDLIGLSNPKTFDIETLHLSHQKIWQLIHQHYPTLWRNKITLELQHEINELNEEKSSFNPSWQDKDIKNHQETLAFHQENIAHHQKLLSQDNPDDVMVDVKSHLGYFWSCYLFGCQAHHNLSGNGIE